MNTPLPICHQHASPATADIGVDEPIASNLRTENTTLSLSKILHKQTRWFFLFDLDEDPLAGGSQKSPLTRTEKQPNERKLPQLQSGATAAPQSRTSIKKKSITQSAAALLNSAGWKWKLLTRAPPPPGNKQTNKQGVNFEMENILVAHLRRFCNATAQHLQRTHLQPYCSYHPETAMTENFSEMRKRVETVVQKLN